MHPHADELVRMTSAQGRSCFVEEDENEEGADPNHLENELKRFGLEKEAIDLLCDRLDHGMSFEEIAKAHGYVARYSARRHYKAILRELKDKGFGLPVRKKKK